jgi:hypothetical protein
MALGRRMGLATWLAGCHRHCDFVSCGRLWAGEKLSFIVEGAGCGWGAKRRFSSHRARATRAQSLQQNGGATRRFGSKTEGGATAYGLRAVHWHRQQFEQPARARARPRARGAQALYAPFCTTTRRWGRYTAEKAGYAYSQLVVIFSRGSWAGDLQDQQMRAVWHNVVWGGPWGLAGKPARR